MRQMQGKSEIYKFKCCITILQTTVIFFFVEKKKEDISSLLLHVKAGKAHRVKKIVEMVGGFFSYFKKLTR